MHRNTIAVIFSIVLLISNTGAKAQLSEAAKVKQLNDLLDNNPKKKKLITNYVLDSAFTLYRNALSGSRVEAGKLIGTSISKTDKGAMMPITS